MPSTSAYQTQPHLDEEHSHMETSQQEDLAAPDLPDEQFLEEESLVKISFCSTYNMLLLVCGYHRYILIYGIFVYS